MRLRRRTVATTAKSAHAPAEEEQRLVHVRGRDPAGDLPAHPDAPAHDREAGEEAGTRGHVEGAAVRGPWPRSTAGARASAPTTRCAWGGRGCRGARAEAARRGRRAADDAGVAAPRGGRRRSARARAPSTRRRAARPAPTRSALWSKSCCIQSSRPSTFCAAFSSGASGPLLLLGRLGRARSSSSRASRCRPGPGTRTSACPAGRPIAAARRSSFTGTIGWIAQARGSKAQPRTIATGSTPHTLRLPVTFQTASRASVSSGMTRPSCCTGSRRSASTSAADGRGGTGCAEAGAAASEGEERRAPPRPAGAARRRSRDAGGEDDDHARHEAVVAEEDDRLARVLRDGRGSSGRGRASPGSCSGRTCSRRRRARGSSR